jgi:hypothetical protein
MRDMMPVGKMPDPERRGKIRGGTPDIVPKYPDTDDTKFRFKWYQRVYWQDVWDKVVTVVATVLKLIPKTAVVGEVLDKVLKKQQSWVDKLIELIQMLIIKLKSWRKS